MSTKPRTKGLNQALHICRDGALVGRVEVRHWDGVKQHDGRVWVFWPFVLFRVEDHTWNITHGPTGLWVSQTRTRAIGVKLIRDLRAAADFGFVVELGRKATRAKQAARHLLPRLQRVG
jgi:hypothetical protein